MILECWFCGRVYKASAWKVCPKHKRPTVWMYEVLKWGKNLAPEINDFPLKKRAKNKAYKQPTNSPFTEQAQISTMGENGYEGSQMELVAK